MRIFIRVDSGRIRWYETRYYPIYYGNPEWGKHTTEKMELWKYLCNIKTVGSMRSGLMMEAMIPWMENGWRKYSDIDYHDGNSAGEVRVMYLDQDEISEKEESFSAGE